MKSLEKIAKKMFEDLVMKRTGMRLDWRYLSPERKLSWMQEVSETFEECLNILEKELSVGKLPSSRAASYERGFIAGQAYEANRLSEKINWIKENLKEQTNSILEKELQ